MSATIEQGTPVRTETPLKVVDRCIGCGAQAFVRVETLELGEFLFCLHDWKKSKANLEPLAIHVQDETHRLLPQPYNPATDNC